MTLLYKCYRFSCNRFHLGTIGNSCNRSNTLVFPLVSRDTLSTLGLTNVAARKRMLETRSLSVGPSFMMQFELVIGCLMPEDLHPLEEEPHNLENVVCFCYYTL